MKVLIEALPLLIMIFIAMLFRAVETYLAHRAQIKREQIALETKKEKRLGDLASLSNVERELKAYQTYKEAGGKLEIDEWIQRNLSAVHTS